MLRLLRSREVVTLQEITTEDVQDAYVYSPEGNQWPGASERREKEFRRWLGEVDNEGFWRGYRLAVLHMAQKKEDREDG